MEKRNYGEVPSMDCRAESNATVDRQKRYGQIVECLKEMGELSAREIASLMCLKGYIPVAERNYAQPRLNELCERGIVEQRGKKLCKVTGKNVTVYGLTEFGAKA